MRSRSPRLLLAGWLLLAPPRVHADPAEEAVEAVLKLRSQNGYSWQISTSKAGVSGQSLPRTTHGSINAAGEIYLEQVWADGLVLETVICPDGAVVHTPGGWFTKDELTKIQRHPKRGSPPSPWIWQALAAFETVLPEEELTRLLNDTKDFGRTGDKIDALLTERGATFWLGSARLIPNATGAVHIRLRNGLIREFRVSAEGENPTGAGAGETANIHVEFESTFTFDYSHVTAIPHEAKQKLKQTTEEK